jgi:hypothetical protein
MLWSPRRAGTVSIPAAVKNNELVAWARTLMAVVGGLLAGALGLTGAAGFAFFALTHAVTSIALAARMRCATADFFPETGVLGFVGGGAFDNLALFVVVWALGYGALWVF